MNNFTKFAFDVDGCLVNKNMELIMGAPQLIESILKNIENPEICIASGASVFEVQMAIDLINLKLPATLKFVPQIIAFGGGFIKCGNTTIKNPLMPSELDEMIENIEKIDRRAAVCFRTPELNFYTNSSVPQEILNVMETLPKSFGILQNLKSKQFEQAQKHAQNIYSLEIISPQKEQIFKMLKEKYEAKGFVISFGTCVEINKIGKLTALKNIFGSLENIVYFGDGYNDIPCFKACGLSFGIGNKKDVIKNADYQIKTHFEPIEILFEK